MVFDPNTISDKATYPEPNHPAVGVNAVSVIAEFEQGVNAARRANDYLMSGFTTILDAGGNIFGVKRAMDADVFPGPRIYPSGASIGQTSWHGDFRLNVDGHPYFDGKENGGHVNQWRHTLIADGVDEVRRAVREQLFRGASQIKIHTGGVVTSFTDPLQAASSTATRPRTFAC